MKNREFWIRDNGTPNTKDWDVFEHKASSTRDDINVWFVREIDPERDLVFEEMLKRIKKDLKEWKFCHEEDEHIFAAVSDSNDKKALKNLITRAEILASKKEKAE